MYEFGGFRLDPGQRLLLRDGKPVSLTPKGFELLLLLIQNGGRLLTKDELMAKLWKDSFVEEANLTVNISALRKTLGDTQDGQAFIETVPKHGYRFVGAVTEVEDQVSPRPPKVVAIRAAEHYGVDIRSAPVPQSTAVPRKKRRFNVIAGIAVLIALIAGAGYWIYRQRSERTQAAEATPRRLAILPFQNLRHDPDSDFLGYSLADAVITKLGFVQSLRVRPSYAIAQYRNQNIEIRKVAADLNVDTLLVGNFIRDGDDLRITCQLVDAVSENILWKGAFDLKYDKLLTVHDNVAQDIIKGLELNLSPSETKQLQADKPLNALAYEYYLRGVDLYARSEFPLAVKMLEKSAELDPSQALTWAYLGRSYNASASFDFGGREHYRKAQAAFEKALALQPTQIEASVYTANWLTDTGHVEQSVPLLRKALQKNPGHAEVHWELGYAYRFAGMLKESAAECERARELDPGVKLNSSALNAYLYLQEYDKFLQSLPKENQSAFILFYRGFTNYHLKNWQEAAADFHRGYELDPSLLQTQVGEALSFAIANKPADGLAILRNAEDRIKQREVGDSEALYKIAEAYALLGDHSSAIRMLRYSVDKGFFAYPYFKTDPLIDSLRNDPEFSRLLKIAETRHDAFKKTFF